MWRNREEEECSTMSIQKNSGGKKRFYKRIIRPFFRTVKVLLFRKTVLQLTEQRKRKRNPNGQNARLDFGKENVLSSMVMVSMLMMFVLISQALPGSIVRTIYEETKDEPVLNKSVQYTLKDNVELNKSGNFLTHYRFQQFGATDPNEIDATAPMVALTFDDGPNPETTPRILEALGENYSHATFFVVGTNAEKYQDVLQSISAGGNELGNHTYNHANLTSLDSDGVEKEINKVNRVVKKATGEKATVIRPPYGSYNDAVLKLADEPLILWNIDTEDWKSRNAKKIVDAVMKNVKDGDIILMHDIYETTADAVEILLPKLKEKGYQVVTVSELAKYRGETMEEEKAYGEFPRKEE